MRDSVTWRASLALNRGVIGTYPICRILNINNFELLIYGIQ